MHHDPRLYMGFLDNGSSRRIEDTLLDAQVAESEALRMTDRTISNTALDLADHQDDGGDDLDNQQAEQPLLAATGRFSDNRDSLTRDTRRSTKQAGHSSPQSRADTEESLAAGGIKALLASRYVFYCALFSALGGLVFGIDQGIVSIILVMPRFLEKFPEIAESTPGSGLAKGLLTAMIELGALIGALSQGYIADRFSRKYSIFSAINVFVIGSILQTAAVDYGMLAWARLIGGIGIGMLSMVVPLYISEISPPELRGSLLVLEELSIVSGIVLAFWITYASRYIDSDWSWRLPFLLQIIPGVILGLGILFLPFSPRWLASQGRYQEAINALSRLRQKESNDPQVLREHREIKIEVQFHREVSAKQHPDLQGSGFINAIKLEVATFADCFRKGCWRRTHVGIGIMFFQQFVGINALIYYSPTLFKHMGLDSNMQLLMSGILNCVQLVGVVASLYTIDWLGRRPLLLIGSILMFVSHLVIAILVGKFSYDWPNHRLAAWTCVLSLMFFMLSFGVSWGPIPWAIPSEIFPSSLRAKGVALSVSSNWLNNFIVGAVTPTIIQSTNSGTYVVFGLFCLLSFLWTYHFVPETNGKTLEEMDSVFGDGIGKTDYARRLAIEQDTISADESIPS